MKQEYFYYALGAAVLVIVILAGALVYALGTSRESTALPPGVQAPALSPEQLQNGKLPPGHPSIPNMQQGTQAPGKQTAPKTSTKK